MHAQVVQPSGIGQYLIPIAVFVVIFALRVRRMSRERPLKIEQLWIVPALYLVVCVGALAARPPAAAGLAALAGGIALGALIGWYRGKTTRIQVDPATHRLSQKASPLSMLILLALVAAKMGLNVEGQAAHWASLGNALLGVALGTLTAMRIEMYLRAKRVLEEHRATVFS